MKEKTQDHRRLVDQQLQPANTHSLTCPEAGQVRGAARLHVFDEDGVEGFEGGQGRRRGPTMVGQQLLKRKILILGSSSK